MLKIIKNILYPDKCMGCRKILTTKEMGPLCIDCYKEVLRYGLCPKCGRPNYTPKVGCLYCQDEGMKDIERVVSLFLYEGKWRKAICRWKYSGIRKYAKEFGDMIVNDVCLIESLKPELLVPVPLAPSRMKKRGFNQALDLCMEISRLTGVPVSDCLIRKKDTRPQSQCTREERRKNILGSIQIKEKVEVSDVKKVLVVDDIYTTGATVKECIKVLKKLYALRDTRFFVLVTGIGASR